MSQTNIDTLSDPRPRAKPCAALRLYPYILYITVCCSVLQCVAVCRSVSQCVAVYRSVSQCIAVYRSVSQCVAVCYSVLQCVAMDSIHTDNDDAVALLVLGQSRVQRRVRIHIFRVCVLQPAVSYLHNHV